MSYVRIWVHIVFTTKHREPILTTELRRKLIHHIKANAKGKGIFIESIGGWSEHLHLLISLGREQTIAKVAMLIKGESARWFNQQHFIRDKLYWQDDYFALSVSETQVNKVRSYIEGQEEHHRAKPFSEEFDAFRKAASGELG
jgi:putative transposase